MDKPLIELGDCDWYAVDLIGQIGLFTSAGSEFVPKYYWTSESLSRTLIESAERMPVICGHEFVTEMLPNYDYASWTDAADRGLFGYDYDLHEHSGYKLITLPNRPVRLEDDSGSWARGVPLFCGIFGRNSLTIPAHPVREWKPGPIDGS